MQSTPPSSVGSPATILVNGTATVAATVTNDSNNLGVDWELLQCDSSGQNCNAKPCASTSGDANTACGYLYEASDPSKTFTLHSASGDTLVYQPPSSFAANAFTVEIMGLALADETKQSYAQIQTGAFGSALSGTYVLQAQGSDVNSQPYQIAGVIVLDGKGDITSGNQTLNTISQGSVTADSSQPNPANTSAACAQNPVPASCNYFYGSTYFIGSDGRGTLTLNNMTDESGSAPQLVQETFSLVVLSSSRILISHVGDQYLFGGAEVVNPYSASGTMETQASTAAPSGSFAFVASGTDSGTNPMDVGAFSGAPVPTALGGVFNIDDNPSSGDISGSGSLADQDYYSYNSNTQAARAQLESCAPPTGLTGTVSPSTTSSLPGVVTINLTGATCFSTQKNGATSPAPASVSFTGYIVDADHIKLIESDVGQVGSGTYNSNGFLTSGVAVSQGSAAGTFSAASLSGQYVFDALGIDFSTQTATPNSFTSATVVNADGAGNFTAGIADSYYENVGSGLTSAPLITASNASTYSVDNGGLGRATLTLKYKSPAPKPNLLFYFTGDGNPLVLYAGGEDTNFRAVGTGIAYLQAQNPQSISFSGNYGIGFTQNSGTDDDGTGQMTATAPANGNPGTLTGTVDTQQDNVFESNPPLSLTDTFECPPGAAFCPDPFGRFSYYDQSSGTYYTTFQGYGGAYYMIDSTQGLFVETDASNATLGYFANACDVTDPTGKSCQSASSKKHNQATKRSARAHLHRGTKKP